MLDNNKKEKEKEKEKRKEYKNIKGMNTGHIVNFIGHTPLVSLEKIGYPIWAKAEFLNPGGSIKDRIGIYMLTSALHRGELLKGQTILEATSGNTGIGLALAGRYLEFEVIIVLPENMSIERKKLIKALGAILIEIPEKDGIKGCTDKVKELSELYPGKFYCPSQFSNPDNWKCHYYETGSEIIRSVRNMNKKIRAFVSGIGSGGSLQGIGKRLKEEFPDIQIIALEPENASILKKEPGLKVVTKENNIPCTKINHKIQGIGDMILPPLLELDIIDQICIVTDEDAINMSRQLAQSFGLLVGVSSGANVYIAQQIASFLELKENEIVITLLPDRVERYFSTSLI